MKTCLQCQSAFEVADQDRNFYDQVSPVFNGVKYSIPEPTLCPDCRQQRRLSIVNERFFYPGTCGLCQKRLLTEHPSYSAKTVYCYDCWLGDSWDARDYGREVDFTRPIFDQIKELWSAVPAQNLLVEGTNVNSEYIHYAGYAKNCYLITHADYCEDCYYGYGIKQSKSCVDGFYNLASELCYDCVDVNKCYDLKGSQDCFNSSSSAFLKDCVGVKHCFLSVGLRNKEYCFRNEQLTEAEYKKRMSEIDLGSHEQYQRYKNELTELAKKYPVKATHGHNNENSSGDHLTNCKNVQDSFDCEDVEDGRFLYQVVTGAKNDYDIYQYGLNLSESYECCIAGNNCYHILFSHNAHVNCSDLIYCWFVQNSKNCFASVNMHHAQYCILNKQYTKEEYEALVPKIIKYMKQTGEWGEFFPASFSPFGYNKTTAQLYFPMTKDEVLSRGWQWDDELLPKPDFERVIEASQLPDSIDDIPDDILNWAIRCEISGRLFKLIPQELKFYRSHRLPIPRRSSNQRHLDRFALRNPRRFLDRQCDQCHQNIRTTYGAHYPGKVYCEECYLKTVY